MRRRDFIALVGGAVALRPLAGGAQPPKMPVIGVLLVQSPAAEEFFHGLKEALRALGYIEGQNIRFELRSDQGRASRLAELATQLVQLKVDVIVTWFTPAARAAKQATTEIPIVMGAAGNPVETGLVQSLAHPGGNVTGIAGVGAELAGKLVEFIREALPSARRIAALTNAPDPFSKPFLEAIQSSGKAAKILIDPVAVQGVGGLDGAFAAMAHDKPDAVIVQPSLGMQRPQELSLKYGIPAASLFPEFAERGGLLSYSTVYADLYRTAARCVVKILKGARPADIPVEQPDRFELTVNVKTARALGLTLPQSFLARADRVIE